MKSKIEILEKLKSAKTWREAGVSISEIIDLLENDANSELSGGNKNETEIKALNEKIARLTESNKKLMAENKKMKGNT